MFTYFFLSFRCSKTPFYLCIVFLIFNCGWNFPRFSQFVESIFRWRKNQSNKKKMCVLQNENKLTAHKPSCRSVCYKFVSACDISYFHDQKFNVAAFCFFLAVHWIPAIFTCFLSLFSLLVPSLCYFLYLCRCRCRYNFTIFVNILMRFSIISIFPPIFLLFVAFADAAATFVPVLALRAQDASILA